jgi:hypothetical protein
VEIFSRARDRYRDDVADQVEQILGLNSALSNAA